jgi:hypothetical protein
VNTFFGILLRAIFDVGCCNDEIGLIYVLRAASLGCIVIEIEPEKVVMNNEKVLLRKNSLKKKYLLTLMYNETSVCILFH